MTNTRRRLVRAGMAGLMLLGVVAADAVTASANKKGGGGSGSTTTGQAIWTNFKSAGSSSTFGYTDTETYALDDEAAAEFYVLTVSGPVVTCTGSPTNCGTGNRPADPDEPAAPAFTVPRADECTLWEGGDLTTTSKKVDVSKSGSNGNGSWKFTWTFTWTGMSDVAAGSGWELVGTDTPGGASITFNGRIAGLSAQKSTRGTKFSFGMTNSDGTPRVVGVAVVVDGVSTPLGSTVLSALDPDFAEFSVGAGYDLSTLMATNGTTSILTTGDARSILTNDYFAGNDNGGSDGRSLAYVQLDAARLVLIEGSHTVTLVAQIKGIDGLADVGVSVTRSVRVQGLGSC